MNSKRAFNMNAYFEPKVVQNDAALFKTTEDSRALVIPTAYSTASANYDWAAIATARFVQATHKDPCVGNCRQRSRLDQLPSSFDKALVSSGVSPGYRAATKDWKMGQSAQEQKHVGSIGQTCHCLFRALEIDRIPSGYETFLLSMAQRVGEVQHSEVTHQTLLVQFYTLTAASELLQILQSSDRFPGMVASPRSATQCTAVIVEFPWPTVVTRDEILCKMSVFGKVRLLRVDALGNTSHRRAMCVYEDERSAVQASRGSINVGGTSLVPCIAQVAHEFICEETANKGLLQASPGNLTLPPPESFMFRQPHTQSLPVSRRPSVHPNDTLALANWGSIEGPQHRLASLSVNSGMLPFSNSTGGLNKTSSASNLVGLAAQQHLCASAGPNCSSTSAPTISDSAGDKRSAHDFGRSVTTPVKCRGSDLDDADFLPGVPRTRLRNPADVLTYGNRSSGSASIGTIDSEPLAVGRSSRTTSDSFSSDERGCFSGGTADSATSVESYAAVPSVDACRDILQKYSNAGIHEAKLRRTSSPGSPPSSRNASGSAKSRWLERGSSVGNSGVDTRIDLDGIHSGREKRTTVMLRNIPNKLAFDDLKRFLDDTNRNTYDFLYLRFDFGNRCNVGYAFISFTEPKHVARFVKAREGMRWSQYSVNSEKVVDIKFARIQGRENLIQKFRNSPVMHQEAAFRPRLYYTVGQRAGTEEPFPAPAKA